MAALKLQIITISKNYFFWEEQIESILELIVTEMKMLRMISSLERTGLDISPYEPRISNTVFMQSCIPKNARTDELKDFYYRLLEQVFDVEITDEPGLFEIARKILISLNHWTQPLPVFDIKPLTE